MSRKVEVLICFICLFVRDNIKGFWFFFCIIFNCGDSSGEFRIVFICVVFSFEFIYFVCWNDFFFVIFRVSYIDILYVIFIFVGCARFFFIVYIEFCDIVFGNICFIVISFGG